MFGLRRILLTCIVLIACAGSVFSIRAAPSFIPVGDGFTYQGQLQSNGSAITDTCAMQFSLWDAASNGTQIGATQLINDVAIVNGIFSVTLNGSNEFGANALAGDARWLEVAVQCPGDADYTTLTPRQALNASPYSLTTLQGDARYVNVDGDTMTGALTVPEVRYTMPRTHYLRIPDAAFRPTENSDSFRLRNRGATFTNGTNGSLIAPVYLPDGAIITNVEFVLLDESASTNVSARLTRKAFDATFPAPSMASGTSNGASGQQIIADNTIDQPVVDNQANNYYIRVSSTSTTWQFEATTIKSVLITYTIEEAE